jgi:hypothetical protein
MLLCSWQEFNIIREKARHKQDILERVILSKFIFLFYKFSMFSITFGSAGMEFCNFI